MTEKEPSPGNFQRMPIREKTSNPQPKEGPMATEKPNIKPSDMIAGVASKLRNLATELDDAAMAMDEKASSSNDELFKLRQLKAALAAIA